MRNQKMPDYFREYMDEKFASIDSKLIEIHKCIYGNGHKGLMDRMTDIENMKVYILGVFAAFILIGSIVGVYVKGFIEQVYKHINH